MSKLSNIIYEEHPIVVNPRLAKELNSADAAIIVQQIHYWCNINKAAGRNFHDGRYWTYNSYEKWHEYFPWISVRTLKTIFKSLEQKGYILSGNYNQMKMDRTKWYTVNYDFEIEDSPSCKSCTMDSEEIARPIPETTIHRLTGKENIVQNDSVLNLREKARAREDDKRKANKERIDELNEIFSKPENSTYLELVNKYVDKWYPCVMGKEHPQLGKPLRMEHALVFKDFISQAGNMDFEDLVDILLFAVQRGGDYEPELKQRIDPTLAWITTKQVLGYCTVKAGFDYAQIQYTDYDFNKETRGLM